MQIFLSINNYQHRNYLMKIRFYVERDFIQRWGERKRGGEDFF